MPACGLVRDVWCRTPDLKDCEALAEERSAVLFRRTPRLMFSPSAQR